MYTYSYPRPAVTVDAILISPNKSVLLIERGREPYQGKWALPGGFIDMDESLEIACRRELEEETGLRVGELKQFKAFGAVDRDPRHRTISVVFYAFTEEELLASAGDDAAKAQWFPLDGLPELAFDHLLILTEFKADIQTFEKMEQLLADYALGQLIEENDPEDVLSVAEAKAYYESLVQKKQ